MEKQRIKLVNLKLVDVSVFLRHCASCVVLTQDNKIMLRQRSSNRRTFPDYLATFGGHLEPKETPMQALVRELNEELGAKVNPIDVVSFGAITEADTNHNELIYGYFWHDKHGTINGCYEDEAKCYVNCMGVLTHPKIMNNVCWLLNECQKLSLL